MVCSLQIAASVIDKCCPAAVQRYSVLQGLVAVGAVWEVSWQRPAVLHLYSPGKEQQEPSTHPGKGDPHVRQWVAGDSGFCSKLSACLCQTRSN